MRTKIQKWGNSLALRIPKAFAAEAGFEKNREVDVSAEDHRLIVQVPVRPSSTLEELLGGVRPSNLHREVDWGPPLGKEAW